MLRNVANKTIAIYQPRSQGFSVRTRGETRKPRSRTQSNACARARMALALEKLNFSCAVIGLTFINRACRQRTGTPKFRGSGCQFPQSQCHPSPRTGIALGTRLRKPWSGPVTCLPKKWQYLTATRQGVARYSLMKSLRNK